ncbi:glucosidase [Cyanobium sp. Maggiore-St4-Cus]|uniref:MGH1-like glycoside hydrolase domain-containing protein n=1 Tax=Cyanobium sp. Maggiore-St4-Cus TaxID=2823717 RepID=UPI0020CCF920|nr:glucosidase [Cyanobium sp. Maggiore-St4-Cus]MCP9790022.1 glucosidase [Cyanobium sp. Maggiore-St4-Cus]
MVVSQAHASEALSPEQQRLAEADQGQRPWRAWGPYLSERQWGTVREDDSPDGDAWESFSHDQARSRTYQWGEDGLAGISDDRQLLCFALALWNGKDPIIKERLFGLTNSEGNHGEDVKEYYYYLDSTPTHSYMRYLYKYPLNAFPYEDLVAVNKARSRHESEYELIDTGIFDKNEYCDVEVEYAKANPEDLLIQITVHNRSDQAASIAVLPTLWFRNSWEQGDNAKPFIKVQPGESGAAIIHATHPGLGDFALHCKDADELVFTDNETNTEIIYDKPNQSPYTKCGINRYIVHGEIAAVNPSQRGTKASAVHHLSIGAHASHTIQLRLAKSTSESNNDSAYYDFDQILDRRKQDCDDYYTRVMPPGLSTEQKLVFRQAVAGMLWSKQFYNYDIAPWLQQRGIDPLGAVNGQGFRNQQWNHMNNCDVISMPDKWEYPWYAAWDLAFHSMAFSLVDPSFAKQQLSLMLSSQYLHPNGQIPAYEWNFGDVNPPVHAWATYLVYLTDASLHGQADHQWLKQSFHKLLINFTWWVNRKDADGNSVFQGGFLGLDNIGIFDRTESPEMGGRLEQADGTAWMAFYAQTMVNIAVELARSDETYREYIAKFIKHYLRIAHAMVNRNASESMWDEEEGFFYDVLRKSDGSSTRLKVRSMVGLIPLCAVHVFEQDVVEQFPEIGDYLQHMRDKYPDQQSSFHDIRLKGYANRQMMSALDETNLRRVLKIMLDTDEFLSDHGIRSISKRHERDPYRFVHNQQEYVVQYLPAESDSGLFGGNSNWRGPIWMPVNFAIIRSLTVYYTYYGNDFKVEFPTGSGQMANLYEIAENLAHRLVSIFTRNTEGLRPVFGSQQTFQNDPHWKDHLLFYEYFHGDNGAGIGASHQTGWSGLVLNLLHYFAANTQESRLASGGNTGPMPHGRHCVD